MPEVTAQLASVVCAPCQADRLGGRKLCYRQFVAAYCRWPDRLDIPQLCCHYHPDHESRAIRVSCQSTNNRQPYHRHHLQPQPV